MYHQSLRSRRYHILQETTRGSLRQHHSPNEYQLSRDRPRFRPQTPALPTPCSVPWRSRRPRSSLPPGLGLPVCGQRPLHLLPPPRVQPLCLLCLSSAAWARAQLPSGPRSPSAALEVAFPFSHFQPQPASPHPVRAPPAVLPPSCSGPSDGEGGGRRDSAVIGGSDLEMSAVRRWVG